MIIWLDSLFTLLEENIRRTRKFQITTPDHDDDDDHDESIVGVVASLRHVFLHKKKRKRKYASTVYHLNSNNKCGSSVLKKVNQCF